MGQHKTSRAAARQLKQMRSGEPRTAKCQCEHDVHFGHPEIRGDVHHYGAFEQDVRPFKTPFATLNLCPDCRATCMEKYSGYKAQA
jgi:hypothetical protein